MENANGVAVVTPSYSRDAPLSASLNRSLEVFLPGATHYILADRSDLEHFRPLQSQHTKVLAKEEVLPRGVMRIPGSRRWLCRWTPRPLGGWLVQQMAKIASAGVVDEPVIVTMDSDTVIVRDIDETMFARPGKVRLFRRPDGITSQMARHVEWHVNVCRLLGVSPDVPPMPDYISAIVSWDRSLVLGMCQRIEHVTGSPWYTAVARTPQFSEGLLYGAYVDKVLGAGAPVWVDESDHCLTYHEMTPLKPEDSDSFAAAFQQDDFAVMISSHSRTPQDLRRQISSRLSDGRLQ